MNALRRRWPVALAATAAALIAAAAAIILVLAAGGDDTPASPTSPTPAPSPTEIPSVSPTPATPKPTRTPTATPTPELSGVDQAIRDALDMQVGMRGLIGYETAAYYNVVPCYACGTGPGLWRAFLMPGTGELVKEQLLVPADFGGRYVSQFAADWERGEFAAGICLEGYCGGESEADPGSKNLLVHARDGGVTWAELDTLPLDAAIVHVRGGRIVVAEVVSRESCPRYVDFASREALMPPLPDAGERPCWYPAIVPGEGLVWHEEATSRTVNANGGPVLGPLFDAGAADYTWQQFYAARDDTTGERYVAWWKDALYLSAIGPAESLQDREPRATWRFAAFAHVRGILGYRFLYGNVELPQRFCGGLGDCVSDPARVSFEAAIIDLSTSTIHPFDQLTEGLAVTEHPILMHLATGRFAVVTGTGDCLNVRAAPAAGAEVLGCYADGVLLRANGEVADAGGRAWLSVVTPDGRPGFAAADFLRW